MVDTRKFCVACKFFVSLRDYYSDDPDYANSGNRYGRCAKNDWRNKVTGTKEYPRCDFERSREGDCGPLAKFWVQREDHHLQEWKDYDKTFMNNLCGDK